MESWKLRSNSGREEQRRPESVAGELQFGIGRELSLILKEIKVALVTMMVMRVMMIYDVVSDSVHKAVPLQNSDAS